MDSGKPDRGERFPVIQEEAHLAKRAVETEQVRVRTSFEQETVTVRDTVSREHIAIRRVPIGREVAEAPPIREEDGITIISVVEERLVVEKRLFLVEEVHLVRERSVEAVELPTELRRTVVHIERSTPDNKQEEHI